jgi:hypothetical protein
LFAEAIASVTFCLVLYQDFKDRLVSDLVWIPAALAVPVMLWEAGTLWWLAAVKLGVLAAAAIVVWAAGFFGEADAVSLAFMGIGTSILSPLPQLVGMSVASISHIFYLVVRHRSFRIERMMTVEEAEKQNVWIPREVEMDGKSVELDPSPEKAWGSLKKFEGTEAVVRGSYGVPLAGYMAIGYIAAFVSLLLNLF